MATCLRCGRDLPVGIKVCPRCGPADPRVTFSKRLVRLIIMFFGFVALFYILSLFFSVTPA